MIQTERKLKRCFKLVYKFYDIELQERYEHEFYFKDLVAVRDWLSETIFYNGIIEADLHGNRSDLKIIITECFISEKKFFVYFKD